MLTIPSFGRVRSDLNRCSQMTALKGGQGGLLSAIAVFWQSEPHGPFAAAGRQPLSTAVPGAGVVGAWCTRCQVGAWCIYGCIYMGAYTCMVYTLVAG